MLTDRLPSETMMAAASKLLDDVSVWLFFDRGAGAESTYIVGSISADRYLTVPESKLPAIRAFMARLNGKRSLDQIERELAEEFGLRMDVQALYRKFHRAGLLADGSGRRTGDIEQMSVTVFKYPINRLLQFLQKCSAFATPLAYLAFATICAAVVLFVLDRPFRYMAVEPMASDRSFFRTTGLFMGVGLASIVIHELSHCFAAASRGILTATLRLQFYWGLIPMAALKFAGLYTLPPRGRLVVWSAGILANLSVTASGLIMARFFAPESALLHVIITVNWLLGIFNLIPLLPTDGYFLITTLTKEPNVRVRAWDWLRRPFGRHKRRLSWHVVAYLACTVWLLLSTFWNNLSRIIDTNGRYRPWESLLSLLLLLLFVVTLWKILRVTEETD
jgi:Zn-dependent protease